MSDSIERFPIRLTRPCRAGDVADVHVVQDSGTRASFTVEGHAPQEKVDVLKAALMARREVVRVDARGEPAELVLTIRSFVDGGGNALARAGEVVRMVRTESAVEIVRGGGGAGGDEGLGEQGRQVLMMLYPALKPADTPTDDAIFGSAVPRAVGEEWGIDAEAAAKSARAAKIAIVAADMTGRVRLAAAGANTLHVEAELTGTNVASTNLPPAAVIRENALRISLAGDFPVDRELPARMLSFTAAVHLVFTTETYVATIDSRETRTETVMPVSVLGGR